MSWMEIRDGGVVLRLRIIPRASRNEIREPMGDALKIKLRAPPVEGKANRELIDFLSEVLDVPARAITILSGATGRMKRVAIAGLDAAAIRKRIPGVE